MGSLEWEKRSVLGRLVRWGPYSFGDPRNHQSKGYIKNTMELAC